MRISIEGLIYYNFHNEIAENVKFTSIRIFLIEVGN
jgi:hypothetical protein